jgi:hypothetical protein
VEPGQPSPHADDAGWPFPAFNDIAAWGEMTFGPASAGLRHGLAVAVQQLVEEENRQVLRESEADVLITAIFCLQEMRRRVDAEAAWLIAEARYKGVSWARIARALEITRQAAHKRFSARVDFILSHEVPGHRRFLDRMPKLAEALSDMEQTE